MAKHGRPRGRKHEAPPLGGHAQRIVAGRRKQHRKALRVAVGPVR